MRLERLGKGLRGGPIIGGKLFHQMRKKWCGYVVCRTSQLLWRKLPVKTDLGMILNLRRLGIEKSLWNRGIERMREG